MRFLFGAIASLCLVDALVNLQEHRWAWVLMPTIGVVVWTYMALRDEP